MSSPFIIVAIDGGAASGKSSTSRAISERFHLLHVDTGSFYRAVTAELLRQGLTAGDVATVKAALPQLKFSTKINGRAAAMEIGGRVAGEEIRSPEVNAAVSHFAAIPAHTWRADCWTMRQRWGSPCSKDDMKFLACLNVMCGGRGGTSGSTWQSITK